MSRAPQDTPDSGSGVVEYLTLVRPRVLTLSEIGRRFRHQPSLSEIGRKGLLRLQLDAWLTWTEQRCTVGQWRAFQQRPAAERAKQPSPLPATWPDADHWASAIRYEIVTAVQALRFDEIDKALQGYSRAREKLSALDCYLQDHPPKKAGGRTLGSNSHPTLETMTQALRDLLQNNPSPRKKDFMKKLARSRDDQRRVNEWLKPHGMTYEDFVRFVKHPS